MKMYMTNKPNGEPFYPVTVAEAVLVSEGETHVKNIYHIERGYVDLVSKLSMLGANVYKVEE